MTLKDAHEIESVIIYDGTEVRAGDMVVLRWQHEQTPQQIDRIMSEGDGEEPGPCILTNTWGCYPSSFRTPRPEELAKLEAR